MNVQQPSLFDATISRLAYGLDGLSKRQDIIATNVANIDTPGYLTHDVAFEQELNSVMSGQSLTDNGAAPVALPQALTRNDLRVRNDGNNVDIDQQMTEMARTSIAYETTTQLINGKFGLLTAALAPVN